jgi:hypothetical protein
MLGQAECVQRVDRSLARLAGSAPIELERQHHVLDCRQRGHEVESLEHVADISPAQRRQVLRRTVAEVIAVDLHSPGARCFQATGKVEQRRLAAPGWTHHGDQLAGRHCQVDAAQGVDLGLATAERFDGVDELENWRVHWRSFLLVSRDSQRSSQRRSASARTTRASATRAEARSLRRVASLRLSRRRSWRRATRAVR